MYVLSLSDMQNFGQTNGLCSFIPWMRYGVGYRENHRVLVLLDYTLSTKVEGMQLGVLRVGKIEFYVP